MAEFIIVDAGCRLGPNPSWLELDAEIIGFDPDIDECERLRERYPGNSFVPFALNSVSCRREFWLTQNPQCSSFYKPDQAWVNNGFAGHKIKDFGSVPTFSLDDWVKQHRPGVKVDILKLDTQGSELDVLKGAGKTLEAVSWVVAEVEFAELYEGQPLFSDVDMFLRGNGFSFWNIMDVNYRSGRMLWGDAYYVRLPNEGRTLKMGAALGCHP